MTATYSTLTAALTACQLQLVKALQKVTKLTTSLANLNRSHSVQPPNTVIRHYCWTHEYLSNHSSRDYTHPKEGHYKGATKADTKGGSAKNIPN